MNALRRWFATFVADDPNPEPTRLDRIGGTYPTRADIRTAVIRATTVGTYGTSLLTAPQVNRVTAEVVALFDRDRDARVGVEAAEAGAWARKAAS